MKLHTYTIFLSINIFNISAVHANDSFSVSNILDHEQVRQFSLGDTDGDGRDEIIFLTEDGQVKIAKNFTHSNSLSTLAGTIWTLSPQWKLEFQQISYQGSGINVKFMQVYDGNVIRTGSGIASVKGGKIEVDINGYSNNPAININYFSTENNTMEGTYKDIGYSRSRSFRFSGHIN
ncbi:hypothetical protein [Vibrio sagamiensis]|uniref:Uncharacterized protein n=1 Tax=Vibrio sagamiensis NBRC 104589 TaxID=1219064 RepID=A0A511QCF6_9VIBR|nr:hypothetical protein [Vibrio sagamiensis]GEM74983.1 hypothetical protein VSA01S_10950 [Vibrio sagamiensis NBRC 104589]